MPTTLRLCLPGVSYSDLFEPKQLKELHEAFLAELASANPELFASWENYRRSPGQSRTPVEVSALLVGVAGHVSRFVTRLFQIEPEVEALATATTKQDPIFRFKIDFVRRR